MCVCVCVCVREVDVYIYVSTVLLRLLSKPRCVCETTSESEKGGITGIRRD